MPRSKVDLMKGRTESIHLTAHLTDEALQVALEDKNFAYLAQQEGQPAAELWEAGKPLHEIAAHIKRPVCETFLILWDLAERGQVQRRAGYLWGVH